MRNKIEKFYPKQIRIDRQNTYQSSENQIGSNILKNEGYNKEQFGKNPYKTNITNNKNEYSELEYRLKIPSDKKLKLSY